MAFSQADIDALKAAIASGVRTVSYADRTVTYQSFDDMQKALSLMESETSGSTSGRSTFAKFSSG